MTTPTQMKQFKEQVTFWMNTRQKETLRILAFKSKLSSAGMLRLLIERAGKRVKGA